MSIRTRLGSLAKALCICALSTTALSSGSALAQAPLRIAPRAQGSADAAAHKAWMNDASDAQEDYRFAITNTDQKAATDALGKLDALMARTEDYWTARKAGDGVKLTKDTRAFVAQALTAVKSGNLTTATAAFDKMGATCNACHELHLETR